MSSRASQIIILCEDKLQEVFVRRFLKAWGVLNRNHKIRVLPYPKGKGSGSGFVVSKFPEELTALRSRSAVTVLIVVIDADDKTVEQRKKELEKALKNAGMPKVADNECVCCVIPRWSIDTWLAYLQGKEVSEEKSYKNELGFRVRNKESKSHPLIESLARTCKKQDSLTNPPRSLMNACSQFEKIRNVLLGA